MGPSDGWLDDLLKLHYKGIITTSDLRDGMVTSWSSTLRLHRMQDTRLCCSIPDSIYLSQKPELYTSSSLSKVDVFILQNNL